MRRKNVILITFIMLLALSFVFNAYAEEVEMSPAMKATKRYQPIGDMIYRKEYDKALALLDEKFDPNNPEAALVNRYAHAYYELAIFTAETKKESRAYFKKGLDIVEKYVDTAWGTDGERAYLIYWNAIFKAKYYQTKGMVIAFFKVGNIMDTLDESFALDPDFAYAHFLKASIYRAMPFGKYSDKVVMAESFAKGIENVPYDALLFYIDFADALLARDWSVEKKAKQVAKRDKSTDGTPMNLSDQEYAKVLLQKAIDAYDEETMGLWYADDFERAKEMMKEHFGQ